MCSSTAASIGMTAVNPLVGIPMLVQDRAIKKQEKQQEAAFAEQKKANDALRKQAEDLGPAAKTVDLTKENSEYEAIKKNKIAMQKGIMGTIKSSPLDTAPVATQKATLGS